MAQFKFRNRDIRKLLMSGQVEQRALMPVARRLAPILAGLTPKESGPGGGGTAASTSIEGGHKSIKGDRVAVRVSQRSYTGRDRPRGGAAAPLQWGNAVSRKRAQFTKALKMVSV